MRCGEMTRIMRLGDIVTTNLLLLLTLTTGADGATKCLKDKDLAEYPVNVYYCEDPGLPECCEKDSTFTCCETATSKNVKDQIALWGAVFGVTGLIAFIWVCYRKDTYLCEGATLKQRFLRCCGCQPKDEEEIQLSELGEDDEPTQYDSQTADTCISGQTDAQTSATPYYYGAQPTVINVNPQHNNRNYARGASSHDSDSGRGSGLSDGSPQHVKAINPQCPSSGEIYGSEETDYKKDKSAKRKKKHSKNKKVAESS